MMAKGAAAAIQMVVFALGVLAWFIALAAVYPAVGRDHPSWVVASLSTVIPECILSGISRHGFSLHLPAAGVAGMTTLKRKEILSEEI